MLLCTRCGKENQDDARFCLSCGASFTGQDESTPFVTTGLDERGTAPPVEQIGTRDEIEKINPQPLAGVGERREPVLVLILGFVTCYLYIFYWWYVTAADLKRATGSADINPPLELVLNLVTCGLFTIYLSYKYPQLIMKMQQKAHIPRNDTTLVSVLLSLFSLGPIACYFIQADLNRIWDKLESGSPESL